MCSKTPILVILFLIKILIILIPIAIYVLRKINIIDRIINYLYIAEIAFISLLIILCIFGSDCIKNSSIRGISLNSKMFDDINYIDEDSTIINYSKLTPSKIYKNNINVNINYYNINLYPYNNINIECENKAYFKNYGNDIAALTTGLSATTGYDISPYDLLEYVQKHSFSCDNQLSSEELISILTSLYGVSANGIDRLEVTSYLNKGKIVLAKTKVSDENVNLSCGEKLIVIYSFNGKGDFNILNPSDTLDDYFCSSNTSGYGSIVKGNQNTTTYSMEELMKYIGSYYVLEVN